MSAREGWEITLDHTDVAVRLENDWHGNYAAHTLARLTGVGIAQGPWRATPAAALRAIGINANPHLEPHNCADEIVALRSERDALRKDAERLREAIDKFLSFQGSTREPEGQAALDAALAVQP